MSRDTVLTVDPSKRIGVGTRRDVYLHPEDETKILKIYREDQTPERRRAQRWYWRFFPLSRFDSNARDYAYYRRLARRAAGPPPYISPIFGRVDTNLGSALVAACVRNEDGTLSENLTSFVKENGLSSISQVIDDFFEELAENGITLGDPSPANILVRESGGGMELVIVDGLGEPTLIPYKAYCKRLNRRKLMLKKGRLFRKLRVRTEGAGTRSASREAGNP